MEPKIQTSPNKNEIRPTHRVFKPAGSQEMKADLIIAWVLLAGFFLGLLANLFGDFRSFLNASERGINNSITPFLLQVLVYFGFPILLIGSGYFLWHAWNYRQKTMFFRKKQVRDEGVVTHLWKEPPSGSGKRYYAGFRYHGDYAVYLQVDVYMFKRLHVGQIIPVDFLPEDPWISYPELPGKSTL
jgi:hypothetical protein